MHETPGWIVAKHASPGPLLGSGTIDMLTPSC
jgi:hypothetical protein